MEAAEEVDDEVLVLVDEEDDEDVEELDEVDVELVVKVVLS